MDKTADRSHWPLYSQNSVEEEYEARRPETLQEASYPAESTEKEEVPGAENAPAPTNNNETPKTRRKMSVKLLQRSFAITESTSPPPDVPLLPVDSPTIPEPPTIHVGSNNNSNIVPNGNNNVSASRPIVKTDGLHQNEPNIQPTLTRGNSTESQYNDQAGVDIEQFIIETLNKNSKDRTLLLKVEMELINLIKDPKKFSHKFGIMSSYQRLLVHRAAHYFGMEHNVDATGHMVIVSKAKSTRLPENRFQDFIRDDIVFSNEPRKSILKRDSASFEETVSFKGDQESQDDEDLRWSTVPAWTSDNSDATKLHPNSNNSRPSRLTKVESYEGKDTLRANSLRSSVSKSFSFGGYDQNPPNARVLTKQDSGSSVSSRVSPTSSGYKSQSQRSDATMSATPSPTATPHLSTQLSNQSGALSPEPTTDHEGHQQPSVLWAVTSMDSVPPGSFLIDSRTKNFLRNEDGSYYRYDPEHPPKLDPVQFYQNDEEDQVEGLDESHPEEEEDASELEPVFDTPSQEQSSNHMQATVPSEPLPYHEDNNGNEVESPPSSEEHAPLYQNLPHGPAASHAPHVNAAPPPPYPNHGVAPFGLPPYNVILPSGGDAGYSMPPSNPQTMMFSIPPQPPTMPSNYERYSHYGPSPSVPLYLPPPNTQPIRYTPCGFPSYPATDRSAPECSFQPAPPQHSYYRCPSTLAGAATSTYCTTSGAPVGLVPMPFATRPQVLGTRSFHHRMSTPPNTQQNGACPQYPMYSSGYTSVPPGCYQPYQTTNTPGHIPLAPILRPGMQLGLNGSPPLRGSRGPPYTAARSPVVREPGPVDSQQHQGLRIAAVPAPPNPIRVLTYSYPAANDIFMTNNGAPRSQHYNAPANSGRGSNNRVRRPRHTAVSSRPVLSLGAASHQQAALATAIEAAGLGVHPPDFSRICQEIWICKSVPKNN